MYKPKETKEIYVDSLSVNSSYLSRQLEQLGVSALEIDKILNKVDKRYTEVLTDIIAEWQRDMMSLETVTSPLRLFIDCLIESGKSLDLSMSSRHVIQGYASAWEYWM